MASDLVAPRVMQRGFVQPERDNGKPKPEERKQPERPDRQYRIPLAWDIRLHRWIRSWVIVPADHEKNMRWDRIRRIKFWVFGRGSGYHGLYERCRQLTVALFGGFCARGEYTERLATCRLDCVKVVIRLPRRRNGRVRHYCGSCACPQWPLSELRFKNWLRKWQCPERRHAGPYPEDRYRTMIADDRERRQCSKAHGKRDAIALSTGEGI